MKQFTLLLLCWLIVAIAATSALLAMQNVSPVSIVVLNVQSIQIPFGLVLVACAACGAIVTAVGLSVVR